MQRLILFAFLVVFYGWVGLRMQERGISWTYLGGAAVVSLALTAWLEIRSRRKAKAVVTTVGTSSSHNPDVNLDNTIPSPVAHLPTKDTIGSGSDRERSS